MRPTPGATARLEREGRAAFPGFRLRVLARTPSTQDVVRVAARAGAAEGWCCVAMEQTAGRGRQGRAWTAPAGSALLASVLLRPPGAVLGGVPLCAGLAVADAVKVVAGVSVGLKWPNDVVAGGGKLAGILTEVEPSPAGPGAVVGIGINLAVPAFPAGVPGVSLHTLGEGRIVPWEEMLAALLPALAARSTELAARGVATTVAAWRSRAVGLDGPVVAQTPEGPVRGTAAGVADDGALLVDRGDGGPPLRLVAGDVHLGSGPVAE